MIALALKTLVAVFLLTLCARPGEFIAGVQHEEDED